MTQVASRGDSRRPTNHLVSRWSPQRALEELGSSADGLSSTEAENRRVTSGPNVLSKDQHTAMHVLVRQVKSAVIYLLAVASIVSYAQGDVSDGTIIAVILVMNTVLGFVQEYRAEHAVEQLARFLHRDVSVKRDGKIVQLDESLLVPGDVVLLEQGDVVPADCKLVDATYLQVNESQLTGESFPVDKDIRPAPSADGAGDTATLLFTGSVIESGQATAVVYAIGDETALGASVALATEVHTVTPYERSLTSFSSLLVRVILSVLILTFVAKLLVTRDLAHVQQSLLFVVALIVGAVPQMLPLVATATLATGALHLARQQVVTKRLSSLEDLGNITLLCTDKTGTLTEGKMHVHEIVADDISLFQLLAAATVGSPGATAADQKSSFDAALLVHIPDDVQQRANQLRQMETLPFDPARRRRSVVIEDARTHDRRLVVTGAVETILGLSTCEDALKKRYLHEAAGYGAQGMRTLAIAYRDLGSSEAVDILGSERDLTFVGFAALADPLRSTARATVERAASLGVAVKILSGDSPEVAAYIGSQVGLGSEVRTGDELEKLPPDELEHVLQSCNVFARVSPVQKYSAIEVLKRHEVVGYQGDGINDVPALKLADVGLAVDTATDVARESAEIVLLNNDLGVIINGIQQGRTMYLNIDKYLKYTLVGNWGNVFALAILFLVAVQLPLLPVQVLLTSMITDIPMLAIASDRVAQRDIMRPADYNMRSMMWISLILGVPTALFELAYFAHVHLHGVRYVQTSMFLLLTLLQFIVIVSIRNRDFLWRGVGPSRLFAMAIVPVLAAAVALPYIGATARLFKFVALPWHEMVVLVGVTLVYVAVLDLVKVWYFRRTEQSSS